MFHDDKEQDYRITGSDSSYDVYTQEPIPGSSKGFAIASFVLSIIGFLTGCFLLGIILDILAIIFAAIALAGKKSGKGLSIAGLIIAILSIILTIAFYTFVFTNDDFREGFTDGFSNEFSNEFWKEYHKQLDQAGKGGSTANDNAESNDNVAATEYQAADLSGVSIADSEYTDKLAVDYNKMPNGDVLFLITNNNSTDLTLNAEFTYTDENGKTVGDGGYLYITRLAAGAKTAAVSYAPYDEDYNTVPYAAVNGEIIPATIDADSDAAKYGHVDAVTVNSSELSDYGVNANITTNEDMSAAIICCLFYSGDEIVGYSYAYQNDCVAGSSYDISFYGPVDENYEDVPFDSFQVFVSDTSPSYE